MPVPEEPAPSISKPKTTKPKTQIMVDNAINSLNDRTGSSLVAIKKFIASTYNIDVDKSSTLIKKYIKEAIASGKLIQTKGKGVTGSFKLSAAAKKEPKPKSKIKLKDPKSKKNAEGKLVKEKKPKKNVAEEDGIDAVEGEPPKTKKSSVKRDAMMKIGKTSSKKEKVTASAKKDAPAKEPKKTATAKKDATMKKTVPAKGKVKPMDVNDNLEPPKKKTAAKKKTEDTNDLEDKAPKKKTPAVKKIKELEGPSTDLAVNSEKPKVMTPVKITPVKIKVKDIGNLIGSGASSEKETAPTVKPIKKMEHSDGDESEGLEDLKNADESGISEGLGGSENDQQSSDSEANSDEDDSSEEKPKKGQAKKKGKVARKSLGKPKSIATLARTAKPRYTKK